MVTVAHYWGIDEVGIYLVPVLVAIVAVRWMEKRARRSAEETEREKEAEHAEDSAKS